MENRFVVLRAKQEQEWEEKEKRGDILGEYIED